MRGSVKWTLAICGIVGFTAFQSVERFPEYVGPLVALTSTETIQGRVTHIRDGDTIELEGITVRFLILGLRVAQHRGRGGGYCCDLGQEINYSIQTDIVAPMTAVGSKRKKCGIAKPAFL